MLIKKAKYNLKFSDLKPLHLPSLEGSVFVDQGISVDINDYKQTLTKIASHKEADLETDGDAQSEFDLEAEIKKHPDSLFVKCFAIKADEPNDNADYFGYDELKAATDTFVGVPVFTNHQNSDINEARGKVIYSWWDEDRKGIMIIARVDSAAYPQLARGIREEYIMGCFPPDAPVLMSDGTEKSICDVENSDIVMSGRGRPQKVLGTRHRAYNHPLLSVRAEGIEQPLVMTSYHNVFVYRLPSVCACGCGDRLPERQDKRLTQQAFGRIFKQGHNGRGKKIEHKYVQKILANELQINDLLIEPKILPDCTSVPPLKEKEAFLIGLFLAEGSYEKRDGVRHSILFNFGFTEAEFLAKNTLELLGDVFKDHRNKPTMQVHPEASQSRVCLYGKDIADWFYTRCGEYSDQKKLNNEIFLTQPKNILASVMAGYIEGDGWNVKNRSYGLTTASPTLASQFRSMLSTIGVRTRFRVRKNTGWGYKPVHEISFGISTAKEIHKRLLYKKVDHRVFNSAAWHSLNDIILRRVKAVEEVDYKGIVYDLEVEEDHSYCVNHIAVSNTSMGCQVKYSLCSICHNHAETPDQYCSHIRERKTRTISIAKQKCDYHKNGTEDKCPLCECGKDEKNTYKLADQQVFEYNYGIKFIENSFVVNPACHDCGVTEIIDPQSFVAKVAHIQNTLPRLIKAAKETPVMCTDKTCVGVMNEEQAGILQDSLSVLSECTEHIIKLSGVSFLKESIKKLTKEAGQKELEDLNTALTLITSVSQSMLTQKNQIDLEFLSDLVEVLSDLQDTIDELTEQGYGRLQSPEGGEQTPTPEGQGQGQAPAGQTEMPYPGGNAPQGTSKVTTGPAGDVGTVTGPMAKKRLELEKLSKSLMQTRNRLNLSLAMSNKKKLDLDLHLPT